MQINESTLLNFNKLTDEQLVKTYRSLCLDITTFPLTKSGLMAEEITRQIKTVIFVLERRGLL